MNTFLWIVQGFLAVTFLYSGICKTIFSRQALVARGQTGVEGLSLPQIRLIALSELLGVAGLILPWWLHIAPVLTPVAALCLGAIMIPAARIHYKRNEYKSVVLNVVLFLLCLSVACGRSGLWA